MAPKVWFITGCSNGLGLEFALAALEHGDHVIATARNLSALSQLAEKGAKTLALDVTSPKEAIEKIIAQAYEFYGRVDILVNNAGYILLAASEEISPDSAKALFETNLFGLIKVTNAFLPYFRRAHSGTIANIGSIGGWQGDATSTHYNASKWAVAGYSLSLREEVKDFGITVTSIDFGYFRTGLLDPGVGRRAADREGYEELGKLKRGFDGLTGKQPGDPRKAARIVVEVLTGTGRGEGREVPGRLVMGNDATRFVQAAIERSQRELDEWKEIVSTTDHDDVAQS